MKAILNALKKISLVTMGLLTGLNAVTISASVFSRFVFNVSLGWPDELAAVSLAWITFLGAAYAVMEDNMMSFNGLLDKFPFRFRSVIRILIHFIMLAFVLVFVTAGSELVSNAFSDRLTSMPVSRGAVYMIIPISGLLMSLALIHLLFSEITDLRKNGAGTSVRPASKECEN